ncbi:ABC transporter substrate-binding protein [Natronorubrum thiooxidans]|uniref:Iron complex transport system substrate-binding protein n=1 Tax=Natronorubrum thiooxidans TaxID=308853 RepID=A0A1N7GMN0_9EURY|nr:ABC transporter substrate-binding protein [Natronorubrum thiooxidans]SIS13871.1 iron complex transport system substrate-binding protein [Natronorubrum thiooxidans]
MSKDGTRNEAPTRRDYMKYGGAVVGGGLLAGCTDDSGQSASDTTGYEVTIEPAGTVRFDDVPQTWVAEGGAWVDMGVALGVENGLLSTGSYPAPQFFYDELGVSFNRDASVEFWRDGGYDKEIFYETDANVHFLDPNAIKYWDDNWDDDDINEISQAVGPICGNNCRRRRDFRNELDYPLYSLYEAFEKVAQVFQKEDRYEALADVHDEVLDKVQSRLPPVDERPRIGLINGGSRPLENLFYPMDLLADGYELKTYRDLGAVSAFEDTDGGGSEADYEYMLEVDPDVLMIHWGIGNGSTVDKAPENGRRFDHELFNETWLEVMQDHPLGRQLAAVQDENILPGAWGEQGPIVNLFQTELTARQLYPEEFGEFDPERYPNVPEEEQLFDRQRVADIINGDI